MTSNHRSTEEQLNTPEPVSRYVFARRLHIILRTISDATKTPAYLYEA